MIIEYIRYQIESSKIETFLKDYASASDSLRASKHCLAYEMSQCADDQTIFILRIEWDSADGHMKEFRSSPEFRSFFGFIKPYVGQIQEMRHYNKTDIEFRK